MYNFHLFCPWKYLRNLPSKVGYFCKIEEFSLAALTTQNYKSVMEIWLCYILCDVSECEQHKFDYQTL